MRIDFNQPLNGIDGKQVEITALPLAMPVTALDQLPDEEVEKYETKGGAARLKTEHRKYLTFKTAAVEALGHETAEDKQLTYAQKLERSRLAFRIYDSNGSCEVTAEELASLKTLIARKWNSVIVGRVEAMIEGVREPPRSEVEAETKENSDVTE